MIHKLYVLPEHQGKGLGKALIQYITQLALDTGHDRIGLKVFYRNHMGIAFYKRLGFEIFGEEKTYFDI